MGKNVFQYFGFVGFMAEVWVFIVTNFPMSLHLNQHVVQQLSGFEVYFCLRLIVHFYSMTLNQFLTSQISDCFFLALQKYL
jgi:hypothetical protein